MGLVQVLGFVLVFIGSVPAARAMLKGAATGRASAPHEQPQEAMLGAGG
jgi:hypothetical protein